MKKHRTRMRGLALLLSMVMLFGSVIPSYAQKLDEPVEESVSVVEEDAAQEAEAAGSGESEAVAEGTEEVGVPEEVDVGEAAEAEEAAAASVIEEEVEADSFDYFEDVTISISAGSNIQVLDKSKLDEGVAASLSTMIAAGGNKDNIKADSTNGYSFIVAPSKGYKTKEIIVKENASGSPCVSFYEDYTALTYDSTKWKKTNSNGQLVDAVVDPGTNANSDTAVAIPKVTSNTEIGYTVSDYSLVKGYKVVTLTPALLQDVIAKFQDKNGTWKAANGSTDASTIATARKTRPVLTITLDDAVAGTFTFEQPTTKGTTELLNDVAEDKRTVGYESTLTASMTSSTSTTTKTITNISLKAAVAKSYDLTKAKITMTIKNAGGENVSNIPYVYSSYSGPDDNKLAEFPYTIQGAGWVGESGLKSVVGGNITAVPFVFDTKNNTMTVSQFIINAAYDNGYTIDLSFDFSENAATEYTLTVEGLATSGNDAGYIVAADGTRLAKVETVKGTAFKSTVVDGGTAQIYVVGELDGYGTPRTVSKVWYTKGTAATKYELEGTGSNVFTGSVSGVKTNLTFHVETTETVSLGGGAAGNTPDFLLYTAKGVKIAAGAMTTSGEPYAFSIQPVGKKSISKVEYEMKTASGAAAVTGTLTAVNGVYTVPAVTGGLVITVTASGGAVKAYDVSISNDTYKKTQSTPSITNVKTTPTASSGEALTRSSRVESAFFGTGDEFLKYVSGIYGSGQTRADWQLGASDPADNKIFGVTVKIGEDWPAVESGKLRIDGIQISTETGSTIKRNGVMASVNNPRVAVDGNGYVTYFGWSKNTWGAQLWTSNDMVAGTYSIQPFAGNVDLGGATTAAQKNTLVTTTEEDWRGSGASSLPLLGGKMSVVLTVDGSVTNGAAVSAPADNGFEKAIHGEPYYFDVTVANGYMVSGVTYTMGGQEYEAELVNGNIYKSGSVDGISTWKTTSVTGDVCINVETAAYAIVKVDGKSKSKVTLQDGREVTAAGIPVDKSMDLTFSIASTANNITLSEVNYYADGGNTDALLGDNIWKPEATSATYTITKDQYDGGDLTIVAKTKEIIDSETYSVEFKNKASAANASEKGTKDGEQLTNTYNAKDQLVSQLLTLAVNEESRLRDAVYGGVVVRDAEYNTISGTYTLSYSVGKIKDSVKVVSPATGTIDATTGVVSDEIVGYAIGEDVITVEATKTGGSPYTSNTEVYYGTLPVKVDSQFTDLYIDSDYDAVDTGFISGQPAVSGKGAVLKIYGTNGRTGEAGQITTSGSGIGKIVWTFDPDITTKVSPNFDFVVLNGSNYVFAGGTLTSPVLGNHANSTVTVKARGGAGTKIKVVAKVYDDATPANLIDTLTKELSIVEAANYVVMPAISVANGATYKNETAKSTIAAGGYTNSAYIQLETLTGGQQTAEISYKIYKQLAASPTTTLSYNSTAANVAKALADKDYEEVTSGITYNTELENGTSSGTSFTKATKGTTLYSTAYATLTGTTSPFTVGAVKKTGYTGSSTSPTSFDLVHINIEPLVNGIAQSKWDYAFRIVDRQEKADVQFNLNSVAYGADGKYILASDETKTTTTKTSGKVVVRTLSDNYLNGYSNVKSLVYAFDKEYTTGVVLTDVAKGTKIKLPAEGDFNAAGRDPRAVFVGWKATAADATLDNEVALASAPATVPVENFTGGQEVIVYGGVTFTAVWAPKYVLDTTLTGGETNSSNVTIGGRLWDGTQQQALSGLVWGAGYIANGTMAMANSYVDPTDAKYDETKTTVETTNYKVYKEQIRSAALGISLQTSLFAYTPYGLASDGKILYRPVNITSGYVLDYVEGATSKDKLTFNGTKLSGKSEGTASQLKATLTESGTTWEFLGYKNSGVNDGIVVGNEKLYEAAFDNKADSGDDHKKNNPAFVSAASGQTKVSSAAVNGYYSIENPMTKLTLQKSEQYKTVTPFILTDKDNERTANSTSTFTYAYALANGGDAVVKLEQKSSSDAYMADITPKAVGTTTLTVTMTDVSGKSFSADLAIEVVADQVVIDITDKDNKAYQNDIVTGLGGNSTGIEFYAAAYSVSDTAKATKLTGTWSAGTPAATNLVAKDTAGIAASANDGTNREKFTFSSDGKDIDSDEVEISFAYTKDGATTVYTKSVPVTTHYELLLRGGSGATKTADKTFITVDGERVLDEEGSEAQETDIPEEYAIVEITTADRTGTAGSYKYNIDLSKYGVEVTKYNATTKKDEVQASTLDFWFYDGYLDNMAASAHSSNANYLSTGRYGVYLKAGSSPNYTYIYQSNDTVALGPDDTINNLQTAGKDVAFKKTTITGLTKADLGTHSVFAGKLTLYPQIVTSPITKAQPNVSTVTLENVAGKEYKVVEISVAPAGSTAGLTLVPEDQGFFAFAGTDKTEGDNMWVTSGEYTMRTAAAPQYAVTTFSTRTSGNITPVTSGSNTRTDLFTLGMVVSDATNKLPKAGTTTLHIYATADEENKVELSNIKLYVNGLNYVDAETTNYIENGELVKNETRTVGRNTYVFDADGKQVTGSKVVTLTDGTNVLVLDGVLAKAGVRSLDSDSYIIGENGAILTGWQDYENNTYYADPENGNKLVDGLQKLTKDGAEKNYYFKSYALVKAPSTANEYANVGGTDYYTNASGEVAMTGIFKVNGVNRLFRENGKIVIHTDSDVNQTTYTIMVPAENGIVYVINKDTEEAAEDEKFVIDGSPVWTWTPASATKPEELAALPTATLTVNLKSDKDNTKKIEFTADQITVTADTAGNTPEAAVWKYTAVVKDGEVKDIFYDASGEKLITAADLTTEKVYEFEKFYLDGDPVWTWTPERVENAEALTRMPAARVVVNVTSDKGNKKSFTYESAEITITPDSGNTAEAAAWKYTAVVSGAIDSFYKTAASQVPMTAAELTDTKTYEFDKFYAPVVKWISKWPDAWTKGDEYPVMTYSITAKSKNGNADYSATESVEAVPVPEEITEETTSVTFTATVDLSSFYKDDKVAEKASDKSTSKTYKFKGGSESGQAEGDYNFDDDAVEDGTFTASIVYPESAADESFDYTGYAIKPQVIVNNGEKTLVEGTDYSLKYKNNTNAGTGEITVTGKGVYSKSLTLNFKINAIEIDSEDVQVGNLVYKTNTKDASVKPVVSYMGKKLTLKKDYTIAAADDQSTADEGTKIFTITGGSDKLKNFTGTRDVVVSYVASLPTFKADIAKGTSFTYDGTAHTLNYDGDGTRNLTLTDTKAKKEFTDEQLAGVHVTYSDNVNLGTCKVLITADGFSGSVAKSFKITAPAVTIVQDSGNADALKSVPYVNTGAKPYVKLVVADGEANGELAGTELVLGRDYKVAWSANKALGTGKAKITFLGNYKGNKSLKEVPFTIVQNTAEPVVSIPVSVTLNAKKAVAGNHFLKAGKNLQVSVNGTLLKTSEYTVEYLKGETVLGSKDAVAAGDDIAVRITPKGNAAKLYDFNGSEEGASFTTTETYTIVDAASKTDLSKAKVKFLGADDKNAKIGYTGTAIMLGKTKSQMSENKLQAYIQLTANKAVIADADMADLEVTYVNNIQKGKATVIISAGADNEKYVGSCSATFTIGTHVFTAGDLSEE